jgi:hypothetical protein
LGARAQRFQVRCLSELSGTEQNKNIFLTAYAGTDKV